MSSRLDRRAEAACPRGRLGSYATATCRISVPGRDCFCGRSVTHKRPIPCDPPIPRKRRGSVSATLSQQGPAFRRFIRTAGETPALPGKALPGNRGNTTDRLRARHLALWKGMSLSSREVGGETAEGVRPRPGLPPEPTGPLPTERTHGFPGDQVPFIWRTAASLDTEASRPS